MTDQEDPLGRAADQLNDALDTAADLFSKRFTISAEVGLPSGAKIRYDKRESGYGFSMRIPPSPGGQFGHGAAIVPIRHASLAVRTELTNHLDALWEACERASATSLGQVRAATTETLAFVFRRGVRELDAELARRKGAQP